MLYCLLALPRVSLVLSFVSASWQDNGCPCPSFRYTCNPISITTGTGIAAKPARSAELFKLPYVSGEEDKKEDTSECNDPNIPSTMAIWILLLSLSLSFFKAKWLLRIRPLIEIPIICIDQETHLYECTCRWGLRKLALCPLCPTWPSE